MQTQGSDGSSEVSGAAAETPPTKWAAAFEAVLASILQDYVGQEAKVRDGMASGMRRLFQLPYPEQLGALRAKRTGKPPEPLSLEDAQRVVFFPRLSDMQFYADAFLLDTPEATHRRAKLMKIKLLSVFYTLHRKDGGLADRFMHCGGLDGLAALLGDENPVIQSEAVELLMEMLSPQMMVQAPASLRSKHLHHKVYLCMCSSAFWRNFAGILQESADRFPRSHENTVRILAGAVGWLRPETGSIPEAKAPPDVSEAAAALQGYLSAGQVAPEVRGVTEDLLSELLDVPKVRQDPLLQPELAEAHVAIFATETAAREDAANAWQALRRLGNDAFGKGLLWPAEAAYRLALQEGSAAVPDHEAALISSNRALVLLKAGHPGEAAEAAAVALARDPRNAKAAYRRAQGLLDDLLGSEHGKSGAAAKKQAEEALDAAELAAKLEPTDSKVADLLARARKQHADVSARAADEPDEPDEPVLDEMD